VIATGARPAVPPIEGLDEIDVARYEGTVDLHVLPPLCPLAITPLDFQHTSSLIERSHASSAAFLDAGCHDDPLRFLALHHHR
jgi:NTE family protein